MPDLPCGFDRADGLDGRPGTPAPAGSIKVQQGGESVSIDEVAIEEFPDSPIIERAEQATVTHKFRMAWNEALTRIAGIGRGQIRTDSAGNIFLVLSATLQRQAPGIGVITIVEESKSFDTPPDEFCITPVELGINILKHPRYFYAFFGDGYGSTTEQQNQMVIRLLQDYFENTSANYRDAIIRILKASIGTPAGLGPQPPFYTKSQEPLGFGSPASVLVAGTDLAKRAACEIVQKYWRGEDTPYIIGYEICWAQYFFVSPWLNPGGYTEDPISEAVPQLPEYFFSRTFPPDSSETIFDFLAQINPQCYSSDGTSTGTVNISWLRKADQVEFGRTWFKLVSTWIGSPIGMFDEDLYNNGDRPTLPEHYREVEVID